jgi:hypothetical protein
MSWRPEGCANAFMQLAVLMEEATEQVDAVHGASTIPSRTVS